MDLIEKLKQRMLAELQGKATTNRPTPIKTAPTQNVQRATNYVKNVKVPIPGTIATIQPKQIGPGLLSGFQENNRFGMQIGLDAMNRGMTQKPTFNTPNNRFAQFQGKTPSQYFTPTGRVEQALLGKQPIASLTRDIQSVSDKLQNEYQIRGVKLGGIDRKYAEPAAYGIGLAYLGSNFLTGGKANPKYAKYLSKVAKPEDIKLIMKFAEWADRTGGKGDPLKAGFKEGELSTIHAIGKDVFGDAASTITNKQLGRAFDNVLQGIAGRKNNLGLGLAIDDVSQGRVSEAGLYDTKSIQNIIRKNGQNFEDLNNGKPQGRFKLTPEEIKVRDEFTEYTMRPEVNAKYEAGAKDAEIINDFLKSRVAQQPVDDASIRAKNLIEQERAAIDDFEKNVLNAPAKPNTATEIVGDSAAIKRGEAETLSGGGFFNDVGHLSDEVKTRFADWVNQRKASRLEGWLKRKEFAEFDKKGLDGILQYQAKGKGYKKVKAFFDAKYDELKKAGVKMGFKDDYLPQLWNNTPEEIQRVFNRSLSEKASFQMGSVIKNYEEGIKAGLNPRFETIGELAAWYESRANRLLADKSFFKYLADNSMILPSGKAPNGWKTLNPDYFPKIEAQMDGTKFFGNYAAPEELAKYINNYLSNPQLDAVTKFANYVTRVKNMTLNFGIPGTGINMHGINELARHTLMGTGNNPVTRFLEGGKFMAFPGEAEKVLNKYVAKIGSRASRAGLTFSGEDYVGFGKEAESFAGQFSKKWEHYFATPLFNKMIPAMKLSSWDNLVKAGMDERDAAKLVNNVYGGINWEAMGRNRDVQNLYRSFFLTPDWGESSIRLGGRFLNVFNPKDVSKVQNRYRQMMATILASYVGHNVVNKITSGHYSYENSPGHIFEIEMGTTQDGQTRYLRPYGTGLDMVRLPAEALIAFVKGDYSYVGRAIRNRLSIPAGTGLGIVTDADYRGQTIGYRGTDKYGGKLSTKEQLFGSSKNAGVVPELTGLTGFPQFGRQFLKTATGSQGIEEGLTQGFELPFRYSGGAYSETQKEMEKVAKDAGLRGEDLKNFNNMVKGLRFSENDKAAIAQGGYPVAQQIITAKRQNADAKAEIAPQEEEGGLLADIRNLFGGNSAEAEPPQSKTSPTDIYWFDGEKTNHLDLSIYQKTPASAKAKAERESGKWTDANKIYEIPDDQVSPKQKEEYYKKMGVTAEEVEYYNIANEDNDFKSVYVQETIRGMNREEMMNQLIQWRKNVGGEYILASGVIDDLEDAGLISSSEAKELKKLDITKQNGTYKAKMTGRGGSAKLKKVKYVPMKISTKDQSTLGSDIIKVAKSPEAPKMQFKAPNLSAGIKVNVPKSPKYKVKFNV